MPGPVPLVTSPAPKLEADAISAAQDAFIGAALVGPTVSVALTLAALAAATAYAAPVTLALTAATGRCPPGSCSRCSCIPAGTARCT